MSDNCTTLSNSPLEPEASPQRVARWIPFILIVTTVLAFSGILRNDFTLWDDQDTIADLLSEMIRLIGHEPTAENDPQRALERLETLRQMLSQAVDQMEESADIHKVSQGNGHSIKKIDL